MILGIAVTVIATGGWLIPVRRIAARGRWWITVPTAGPWSLLRGGRHGLLRLSVGLPVGLRAVLRKLLSARAAVVAVAPEHTAESTYKAMA